MISDNEIRSILDNSELTVEGIIQVIQRYIYDKKQVEVNINKPLNRTIMSGKGVFSDTQLMDIMFEFASEYYINKFK